MPKSITERIHNEIAKGHTKEAIQLGLNYTRTHKKKFHKHFVSFSAQYNEWNEARMLNVGAPMTTLNRINLSVYTTAEELEERTKRKQKTKYSKIQQGQIVTLENARSYGFIKANSSSYQNNIFFHYSRLKKRKSKPKIGQKVSFQTTHYQGKLVAINVALHDKPSSSKFMNKTGDYVKSSFVELYKLIKTGLNDK
ncbi:MAG: cold shock domain-containing protein [Aureispira sp.]